MADGFLKWFKPFEKCFPAYTIEPRQLLVRVGAQNEFNVLVHNSKNNGYMNLTVSPNK